MHTWSPSLAQHKIPAAIRSPAASLQVHALLAIAADITTLQTPGSGSRIPGKHVSIFNAPPAPHASTAVSCVGAPDLSVTVVLRSTERSRGRNTRRRRAMRWPPQRDESAAR